LPQDLRAVVGVVHAHLDQREFSGPEDLRSIDFTPPLEMKIGEAREQGAGTPACNVRWLIRCRRWIEGASRPCDRRLRPSYRRRGRPVLGRNGPAAGEPGVGMRGEESAPRCQALANAVCLREAT